MKKNHFLKNVNLVFNYFDEGSLDAILKISMEMQHILKFILFIYKGHPMSSDNDPIKQKLFI